jgi:phosphate-selective porin
MGLEALWADENYSILTEYTQASVGGTMLDHPRFYGFYITGSYMFNGKVRAYDRRVSYARRPPLTHPWGNFEVVGRYSHLDVTDAAVDGGVMNKWLGGLSWWATADGASA